MDSTSTDFVKRLLIHELDKVRVPESFSKNELLNVSMEALYKIATCEGYCRGGDHIIESLTGRGFNHLSSALVLTSVGYYDESLNLLRSVGELTNILQYLILNPELYPSWVLATKKQRLKEYAPAAIRSAIRKAGKFAPAIDDDVYAELCETATHVTSKTAPNAHGADKLCHIAGYYQKGGEESVLDKACYLAAQLAMVSSKMVGRNDLLQKIVSSIGQA